MNPRQDVEGIAWEKKAFEHASPYALRKKALDEKLATRESEKQYGVPEFRAKHI